MTKIYSVVLQKTGKGGIYLLVGQYRDEHLARAVFQALMHHVVNPKYDFLTLDETASNENGSVVTVELDRKTFRLS